MVKKRPTESFELEYPIEVDGVEVSTLTVRRPTVRDQLNMERKKGSEAEKGIGYFAALCEMAPPTSKPWTPLILRGSEKSSRVFNLPRRRAKARGSHPREALWLGS